MKGGMKMTMKSRLYLSKCGIADTRIKDLFDGLVRIHSGLTQMDYEQRARVKDAGGIKVMMNEIAKIECMPQIPEV